MEYEGILVRQLLNGLIQGRTASVAGIAIGTHEDKYRLMFVRVPFFVVA